MFNVSTIMLLFFVIAIGLFIGKIRIKGVSLGYVAILLVAIFAGYILKTFLISDTVSKNELNLISQLGMALFISTIGLSTGNIICGQIKKQNFVHILIGAMCGCFGITMMKIISALDKEINITLLKGILCGAITSTPGLSSVCEPHNSDSELAIIGYGCSYLFGVLATVFSVQCIAFKNDTIYTKKTENSTMEEIQKNKKMLIWIALSVILGNIVGNIQIPVLGVSIGDSAGILCLAILFGALAKRFLVVFCKQQIDCYRELGLILFFVGNGINAGMKIKNFFDIKCFLYGIFFTVLSILFVYIIGRFILKAPKNQLASLIAGAMTSTPSIGILLENSRANVDLSAYSLSYLGALLSIVIFI